jgi:hypothetical protein
MTQKSLARHAFARRLSVSIDNILRVRMLKRHRPVKYLQTQLRKDDETCLSGGKNPRAAYHQIYKKLTKPCRACIQIASRQGTENFDLLLYSIEAPMHE